MSYYEQAMEKARAQDGNESARSKHLAATVAYLRGTLLVDPKTLKSIVFVEDDGVRILIRTARGDSGRPATEWLAEVDPASAQVSATEDPFR